MKKTLLICSQYPLPENIGMNMRTMNFVRFFGNFSDVDIACYKILQEEYTRNSIFSNVYLLKLKDIPPKSFKNSLLKILKMPNRPWPILEYCDDSKKLLLSLIESKKYDYIFMRYIINTNILFKLKSEHKKRTIIDFDDILSDSLYDSMYGSVNGLHKKFIISLNKKLLINYEKKCLNFGASIFCSEKDRGRVVKNHVDSNAFIVPNTYENKSFEDYNFGDGFNNGNILLFVGTLGYKPNLDGLKWFIESVFPVFKIRFPNAKLLVVGRSQSDDIKNLCEGREGIELHANVPDIKEFYKKCKTAIVPLLAGGGTRIKILEAALSNRPVLSTPIGAEGLDLTNETDLLLFENAQEFSTQYGKLLDSNKYNSLIQSAKKEVLTKYSMKNFNDAMERVLIELDNKKHSI